MKSAWLKKKTLFLTAVIGACGTVFFNQLQFPDSSRNFLGSTRRAELSVNGPITQVFRSAKNNLEGFQIFMGDTDLGLGERIDFTILDANCQTVIHRSSRTMFSPPATRGIRFAFPALSTSADTSYCLSVGYHPGLIEKKERPYIRVAEDEQSADFSYADHGKGKTYAGRTLEIRPLYVPEGNDTMARITALENRLSQYKPAFAKGSMLVLGLFGLLLGIAFFAWIARREGN